MIFEFEEVRDVAEINLDTWVEAHEVTAVMEIAQQLLEQEDHTALLRQAWTQYWLENPKKQNYD